ncbi:hypothetical protein ACFLSW_03225 [Candidatus Bipolaricaulota bacterium]
MRTVGAIAILVVISFSIAGWAQCGCGIEVDPDCYLVFKTNETVEFTLVAPADWFQMNGYTQSPHIFGWRVETQDGLVVRTEVYPGEPRSRLTVMEWDLTDLWGDIVPSGYYNIIVMTTHGDVSYKVFIEEACRTYCGCFCDCSYTPPVCDIPCRAPFGQLYLKLGVGEVRPCNGLSFSVTINLVEEPAP